MSVTVAMLIYKSPAWLRWGLNQLAEAENDTPFEMLVVGNDANMVTTQALRDLAGVEQMLTVDGAAPLRVLDHRNPNPREYAMARVYRAWNRAVQEAGTDDVVLVNSDMAYADGWLDALLDLRCALPGTLPTSLLVESGRLASGLPEYVRNFGREPATFDRPAFVAHADMLKGRPGFHAEGGLFMPVLWDRAKFLDLGGYPIQEPNHKLASDAVLFGLAHEACGLVHRTATKSIVYHVQRGEMDDEP